MVIFRFYMEGVRVKVEGPWHISLVQLESPLTSSWFISAILLSMYFGFCLPTLSVLCHTSVIGGFFAQWCFVSLCRSRTLLFPTPWTFANVYSCMNAAYVADFVSLSTILAIVWWAERGSSQVDLNKLPNCSWILNRLRSPPTRHYRWNIQVGEFFATFGSLHCLSWAKLLIRLSYLLRWSLNWM